MIALDTRTIGEEIRSAKALLQKWEDAVAEGIPGIDGLPATEDQTEDFLRKLAGELMLVAGKCENVASILNGER